MYTEINPDELKKYTLGERIDCDDYFEDFKVFLLKNDF